MILSQHDIAAIQIALEDSPFNANPSFTYELARVLTMGNKKHGAVDVSVHSHLQHATQHIQKAETETTDEDGLSHRSHAAARLILGLIALTKGESDEQR